MRPSRFLPVLLVAGFGSLHAQAKAPKVADFLSPASPLEVAAAKKAEVVAWVSYERGLRNIYVARAPDWKPLRITRFLDDDGVDVGGVRLSDDGTLATFVRGHGQNRAGWVANPSHDPRGGDRSVWAARTDGSGAWRMASIASTEATTGGGFRGGGSPELSPDGHYVVFVRDGQIYRAATAREPGSAVDTAGIPFIRSWGRPSNPVWSPDGRRLAFVSMRDNHSFIGIYDMAAHTVGFMAPSTDFDTSPTWSPDGKRIAFIRKPGTPFGQQVVPNPTASGQSPAPQQRPGGQPSGCRPQQGGGLGSGFQPDTTPPVAADGLCRAAFAGGYTISFMVGDVATLWAREFWHNQPTDRTFTTVNTIGWAGDRVVFGAQVPRDEWDRFFSVSIENAEPDPVLLTTTDGLINDGVADRTFATTALSRDGKTLYYATNATDIERRHVWAVPVAGGTPTRISTGGGVEVSPTPIGAGGTLAVLCFDAAQPASIGLVPASGGAPRIIFPALGGDFPKRAHVTPAIVITRAPDGLEIHNQLFLPSDLKPGARRPAIVFVHGGPSRQMLPAYHYMQFYHWAYAYNQYLQSQGYVVLSVNYRLGIGYGNSFRRAANTRTQGNAEYQDVLAGARYLQSRPDVDPGRIGIWGLSYGGLLTAEALARNSDVFVAGVDLAGVHLYGSASDTTSLAFRSSSVGAFAGWKSPVFLVHGDDDRNVDFSQTVGLVSLLRAKGVYYELMVIPDDVHESLLHSRWLTIFDRSSAFLHRFVWEKQTPPSAVSTGGR